MAADDSHPLPDKPSKTRRKQAMHALQDLGEQLVTLSAEQLARIDLPERLRDAVVAARQITRHEARRRQMQFIGRLMRDADPAPITAAIAAIAGTSASETARLHRAERLREQLLESETVLGEIAARHPQADLQQLRSLRRNALKERELGRPPRHFRELFRRLRDLDETAEKEAQAHDEQ